MIKSALQIARASYQPKLPTVLRGNVKAIEGEITQSMADQEKLKELFSNTYGLRSVRLESTDEKTSLPPFNVGVMLSGGQAPGGHNVIAGLFDKLISYNPGNRLFGILMGPYGMIMHKDIELTADLIDEYRNTGGFDMLATSRTKFETEEQLEKCLDFAQELNLKAVVVIGGDDSNTNAAILAEYFAAHHSGIQVIGVPKTIDGDVRSEEIEASFGFDTATKVYSEIIGNIERDSYSSCKYWHFVRLMGRSASHIALECALQTQPNYCIISEEVQEKNKSLNDIVMEIATVVAKRAEQGHNFGVVLIPEGLIEFIPSIGKLIDELNDILSINIKEFAQKNQSEIKSIVFAKLSEENSENYTSLPEKVASQLLFDRDPHGNVQVSKIETEKLISEMVGSLLKKWKEEGKYNGKFARQHHFLGYEGRCASPSNFDSDYCYALGVTASNLILCGKSAYIAFVGNITKSCEQQIAGGVPLTKLLDLVYRNGEEQAVIHRTLVNLNGLPFKTFEANRDNWAIETAFVYPGPIQFFGPDEICNQPTKSLALEHSKDK